MQRYNTFNQIHKALRALLYDAALCLQQTDFTIKEERDAAVEKVVLILDLFETHAQQEDGQILPAVFQFEPSVADVFEQEHVTDTKLIRALETTISDLYRTNPLKDVAALGRQLTSGFVRFMIFNLNHMAKEEEVLNEILWRYYSDDEIKQIESIIRQNAAPEKQAFVAKWMLLGGSNSEAVTWLKALQKHAPAALFQKVFAIAEAELPAIRFQQIATYFFEDMTAA